MTNGRNTIKHINNNTTMLVIITMINNTMLVVIIMIMMHHGVAAVGLAILSMKNDRKHKLRQTCTV